MFRLKEIREYEGYSLSEIAKKIYISKSSYADWESARTIIPLKHMVVLANIYHVSLDYLFGLSDDMSKIFEKRVLNSLKISNNIKSFRIEKGLSQEQLAQELFVSHCTLSRYATNNLLISTACIYELCIKYKFSFNSILYFK